MSKLKLTNSINSSLQHSISPTCCLFTRTAYGPKIKTLSASIQRQTASLLNSSDKTNILPKGLRGPYLTTKREFALIGKSVTMHTYINVQLA